MSEFDGYYVFFGQQFCDIESAVKNSFAVLSMCGIEHAVIGKTAVYFKLKKSETANAYFCFCNGFIYAKILFEFCLIAFNLLYSFE